ncbi:phosphonate transport system permease protein [Bacillus alveayuensis]|jgi:phosphonate transport system permease protein|uniref:Phosphonate transport system permease protein n=2 Tax=Aeribacillus alveayuensis TaxID=279215 RepID=A0ABT9VRL4_9BACI|nr:phosphonate transport system permease protein [Bacillus alveayuensis]
MNNEGLMKARSTVKDSGDILYTDKIKVKPLTKASIVIRLTLVALLMITVYGFAMFDYGETGLFTGLKETFLNFKTMFLEASFSRLTITDAIYQVLITLGLAFLTTIFGAIIALFLGLLAAQNLSNQYVSNIIRAFVAFIRAVPTVLWVLIFSIAAGLGSVAAVIGMTFHSVGYLIKAYSESFEELDEGVIEALKSCGANWWQIVFQAVIPSSITYLISWTFIRFEINFSVAVAMGAAAGAGGIGFDLFMASGFYFDLREIGIITYFILALAMVLEVISSRMKLNLRVNH